jgi:hypothetical protein
MQNQASQSGLNFDDKFVAAPPPFRNGFNEGRSEPRPTCAFVWIIGKPRESEASLFLLAARRSTLSMNQKLADGSISLFPHLPVQLILKTLQPTRSKPPPSSLPITTSLSPWPNHTFPLSLLSSTITTKISTTSTSTSSSTTLNRNTLPTLTPRITHCRSTLSISSSSSSRRGRGWRGRMGMRMKEWDLPVEVEVGW